MAHRRFVAPILALVLGIPVFLAMPKPVAAACYWSTSNTVQTSRTIAYGATWTGKVTYRIGFNCNGGREELKIESFTNTMKFTNAISPNVYHEDQTAKVMRWFNHFYSGGYYIQWQTFNAFGCFGNCTLTRVIPNDVVMPYYSTAATYGYWIACGTTAAVQCRVAYKFLQGIVAFENL